MVQGNVPFVFGASGAQTRDVRGEFIQFFWNDIGSHDPAILCCFRQVLSA